MPKPNSPPPQISLRLYFDEWSRCLSSMYQRDSLYRFGRFDSCGPQWSDLKTAIRAKTMVSEPEKARGLLESTHYALNLGSDPANSPTAGVIWELKEKPGWDAED
uniref:Uncharacterized protein n=1 Tax=Pseudictyota dubia TaxID=2749911 RepID=A0A6U2F3N9_9STRA|mmetsp:Transcript_36694/g.67935  ORF Transcript_36694/g.67935 Transcript_36694/m.67935 type:complete len:105 (+) Transcript_36694:67-381(+)